MLKTNLCSPALQPRFVKKNCRHFDGNAVPRKPFTKTFRRITAARFTALPEGYQLTIPAKCLQLFVYLWEESRGSGQLCAEHRFLAEKLGKGVSTIRAQMDVLVAAGKIKKHLGRRISRTMSEPNTYTFPELEGFYSTNTVLENEHQQPEKILNTSTEAAREVSRDSIEPSYAHLRHEHNRSQNHPPAMRALYEQNGSLRAELRILRRRHDWKQEEREHRAMQARIGTNCDTPHEGVKPMTDEEVRQFLERQKEHQKEREESAAEERRLAAVERQRKAEEWLANHDEEAEKRLVERLNMKLKLYVRG